MNRILATAWALPVVALGRFLALLWRWAGWGRGIRFNHASGASAMLIHARGPVQRWLARKGWHGVAIGDCIWLWVEATPQRVAHEIRHVWQWRRLGVLFLPVYLTLLAAFGYRANMLELDAREFAKG